MLSSRYCLPTSCGSAAAPSRKVSAYQYIVQLVEFADVKVKQLGGEGGGSVKKQAAAITEQQDELLRSRACYM